MIFVYSAVFERGDLHRLIVQSAVYVSVFSVALWLWICSPNYGGALSLCPPFLISPPGRCVPVRCTIVSCCLWYELMCSHLLWLNGTVPRSAGNARRYIAKDCPPLPPAVRSLESLKTSRSVPPRLRAARERFSAARQRLFVLII